MKLNLYSLSFLFVFVFYVIADMISTVIALKNPDNFELSPFVNLFESYLGFNESMILGKIIVILALFMLYKTEKKADKTRFMFIGTCLFIGLLGVFAFVNNMYLAVI